MGSLSVPGHLGWGGVGPAPRREGQRGSTSPGPWWGTLEPGYLELSLAWGSVLASCPDLPKESVLMLQRYLLSSE